MMNIQRSDTDKINLIEEGETINIDEVIRHSETINKSLKYKYKTMPSYCFKFRKKIQNV